MNTNTKENKVYKENPDILSFISIENGKIVLNVNEEKLSVQDFMVILSNILLEYTKSVATLTEQSNKQNNKTGE